MTDISNFLIAEEEVSRSIAGFSYISKRVYLDAYLRITIHYDEKGLETKRDEKHL